MNGAEETSDLRFAPLSSALLRSGSIEFLSSNSSVRVHRSIMEMALNILDPSLASVAWPTRLARPNDVLRDDDK